MTFLMQHTVINDQCKYTKFVFVKTRLVCRMHRFVYPRLPLISSSARIYDFIGQFLLAALSGTHLRLLQLAVNFRIGECDQDLACHV